LADPRNPNVKSYINQEIKYRKNYRPYAPAVLSEYVNDLFLIDKPSPYMELTLPYRPEIQQKYPAI
jgi:carbamoyltransferase